MRSLRNQLLLMAVVGISCLAAYELLLTREAKEQLKGAVSAVSGSYNRISNIINNHIGIVMEEDVLPNREDALRQWAEIGYGD